jgi:hypothetical protein
VPAFNVSSLRTGTKPGLTAERLLAGIRGPGASSPPRHLLRTFSILGEFDELDAKHICSRISSFRCFGPQGRKRCSARNGRSDLSSEAWLAG